MKNVFIAIGNFFKKIGLFLWKYIKIAGLFLWKYIKICWVYIKDNAWIQPIVLVVLIFGLVFGFQGIVDGIEKAKQSKQTKEEEQEKKYTKITMSEALEKIDKKEDFVLFIGAHSCSACISFTKVVNRYITDSNKAIFYIDIEDTNDVLLRETRYLEGWKEELAEIETRSFDAENLATPTVVIIRGGEFVDAKSGAHGLSGGMEYLSFVKFVDGEYIGKLEEGSSNA